MVNGHAGGIRRAVDDARQLRKALNGRDTIIRASPERIYATNFLLTNKTDQAPVASLFAYSP
jgi:hypothetical protein